MRGRTAAEVQEPWKVRRHELTEQGWELLAPLIPRASAGRPRVEQRLVINGMVYKIRTGISWRDLPERCDPWPTVCTCFRRCTSTASSPGGPAADADPG
ncbi:transposase [Streptomyces sp. Ag109_O5-1]|uniref:transposase n=1 Tax=Streptomyces sp. Ag109_O5-1 TaxID=1938851 RepID=UPI000F50610B